MSAARAWPSPINVVVGAVLAASCLAQTPAPAFIPVDWPQRDLEARWLAYRQDVSAHAADKNRKRAWATWLGERREFDLLEWITIYEGWAEAGQVLRQHDAPQWMRACLWNLGSADSHDFDSAKKTLRADAARVLGWAKRFPLVARGDDVNAFLTELATTAAPADPGPQLPPLDDAEILLSWFDVPKELAVLGDRTRIEPGRRYVHQVVRALRAAHVRASVIGPHSGKIAQLIKHPDNFVRTEATAALSRLPGTIVPHERLLDLAHETSDVVAQRLATTALSYSTHPAAFFALHTIAADGQHPGALAARQRLADIGDAFTLRWLDNDTHRDLVSTKTITTRLRSADRDHQMRQAGVLLERAVWALAGNHALASLATDALIDALRGSGADVVAFVSAAVSEPLPWWTTPETAPLTRGALLDLRQRAQAAAGDKK